MSLKWGSGMRIFDTHAWQARQPAYRGLKDLVYYEAADRVQRAISGPLVSFLVNRDGIRVSLDAVFDAPYHARKETLDELR